jgi:hypothetical protein
MINKVRKLITGGIITYMILTILYIMFIVLFIYFKNVTHSEEMTYTIVSAIFILLNINIMSIVFIIKFNKIIHKLDDLIYTLGYEE